MKVKWTQKGNDFLLTEVSAQVDVLPKGIYKLEMDQFGNLFLSRTNDKFEFPYKIYGVENNFVDKVAKTYKNTTGNFGILFNGLKGTGKTVTAELICNKLDLPVIVVYKNYKELTANFINKLQQDVVLFFDEYEKVYSNYDFSILTVMDGVFSNKHRKTFLLTTNSHNIDSNMLQRPSRIRYVKEFTDLKIDTIIEIVDDTLRFTKYRQEVLQFISELKIITIDIVKAVVEEVNIHEIVPEDFKDIFNVKKDDSTFDIFTLHNKKQIPLYQKVEVFPKNPTIKHKNQWLTFNQDAFGKIREITKDGIITVSVPPEGDPDEIDFDDMSPEDEAKWENMKIFIQPAAGVHYSFLSYNL